MDDVQILPYDNIYKKFIDGEFLHGYDEYYFRNQQAKKPQNGWRHLRSDEVEDLVKNSNSATNWDDIWVTDEFDTSMIRNNRFFGMVRIGRVTRNILQYHDLRVPIGITDCSIISCDIGDDAALHDVHYMANYIIGDKVVLFNIQELSTTNHSKFGSGVLKEGEPEDVRVWLELMNESGARKVLPFNGMITADAYLWAKYVDDKCLQGRLFDITQKSFDNRRGYYGVIGDSCVIKNSWILKDVNVGSNAYIKGASKIKNVTINSSEAEPTQIGEGVILVNGIVGYGCHIFYSVVATRFVVGNNCNLKYGARLIHTVLGDNSTISCCEVLNNLIFPSHEQHHNSSFLIASCVMGQSNMAAGATIGSNHNSRAADGEINAKRGFWPGLCSSVKHSSTFASFTLLSKADYPHELNIRLPFSLVNNNTSTDELEVMPAYWWMYDMYALARNTDKYYKRDKRLQKVQHIEFETFAPDTMEETIRGRVLLECWFGKAYLLAIGKTVEGLSDDELRKVGKNLLAKDPDTARKLEVFGEGMEAGRRKVRILKAYEAYCAYGDMLIYYSLNNAVNYLKDKPKLNGADLINLVSGSRIRQWINLGGQLVCGDDLDKLKEDICNGTLNSWKAIHERYDELWEAYPLEKLKHSYQSLLFLLDDEDGVISHETWLKYLDKVCEIKQFICDQVYITRKKDFDNDYRNATFRNEDEKKAVLGEIDEVSFVKSMRNETKEFIALVNEIKKR